MFAARTSKSALQRPFAPSGVRAPAASVKLEAFRPLRSVCTMHPSLFEGLETKYAQHASWAIWNRKDPEDTTVIRENLADLKTSVVMVALNISRALSGQWQNFHSRDHARKLMYAFNQSPYRG